MKKTLWTFGYNHPELSKLKKLKAKKADKLKVGRELDALVAKHVLGCTVVDPVDSKSRFFCGCDDHDHADSFGSSAALPEYSWFMTDAWDIVEAAQRTTSFILEYAPGDHQWLCCISESFIEIADTAPHAICLTALSAAKGGMFK